MNPFFPRLEPARINEYFRLGDEFTKAASDFATLDPKAVDPAKLYEAQRRNMEALVEANRKAAAAYEELFRNQVQVLRKAAEQVQQRMEELRAHPASALEPQKQAEAMQAMIEETAGQLAELAESAAKLNADALEGMGKQLAANATALAAAARS